MTEEASCFGQVRLCFVTPSGGDGGKPLTGSETENRQEDPSEEDPPLTGASWLHKHALRLIQKHLPFKYSWQICLFNQAAVKHRWHFTKVKNCFFKLKVKWAHQKHAWNSRQWGYFTCTLTLSSSWGSLCANYSTKRNFVRTNAQTWIGVLSQNLMLTYYYILFLMVKKKINHHSLAKFLPLDGNKTSD